MQRFYLAPYSIRVRKKRSKTPLKLDRFLPEQDLFTTITDFLAGLRRDYTNDEESQRIFRVLRAGRAQRQLAGIIETGDYGYEATLLDVEDTSVAYRRRRHHAELLPFYYLFSIPTDADEGILIVQRTGQAGIVTALHEDLSVYIRALHPDLIVDLNPLVPEFMVRQYLDRGGVAKIRFVRFGIPTDLANAFDTGHVEQNGTVEMVVSASRNEFLPLLGRIREVAERRRGLQTMVELQENRFRYDTVKVELQIGRSRRTLDLSDPSKLRAYHDVTDTVRIGNDGHPDFDSINQIAGQFLRQIQQSIGQ